MSDHNSEMTEYPIRNGFPKTNLLTYQFCWNFLNNQASGLRFSVLHFSLTSDSELSLRTDLNPILAAGSQEYREGGF